MSKNLLQSSKLEIITSKKITTFLYLLIGLAILVWWSGSLWQFFYAYIIYGEFDGPISEFILITIVFFFPLFVTGCWMLSGVIQRQRILVWIKRSLIVNDYETRLGPATAGLLIDYEYNKAEIWGSLLKLHFQGNIEISSRSKGLVMHYKHNKQLGSYEELLLKGIFPYSISHIEVHNLNNSRVINAGLNAHKKLVNDLEQIGAYGANKANSAKKSWFIKAIYGFAGITAGLQIAGMLFGGDEYWGLSYPRYDVSIVQPILLIIITIIGLIVILSGFRLKLSDNYKSRPSILLLQSSGFYAYLKNVYGKRLSEKYIQTQAVKDIRTLTPYIVAYKLQPLNMSYIRKILDYTSKNKDQDQGF